ncbi:hypothetical protein CHLRE_17g719550v5 [Chlamydomonas reinhardtii]|uniref:SAGA-associated factor 11 n=1 Tax=Chlamydomonas reinhardtii TaxID=3055 RepID=A8JIK2_CHLRE|nr:uncharacterized protein CHLRE_17g719550v5 [Chlamydomonas reinhardtii]PNW70430.1 hypothetical protein CHLRE_17g719550v5 [Chlamydomonas reinhardtii]|eukprot:XP_001703794.1 predicted protein [Chlamydomonas reinhardtii]
MTRTEEDRLRRQIAILTQFKDLLQNESSVASQTVAVFAELLDEVVLDVSQEVHREARTGRLPLPAAALPADAAAAAGGQAAAAAGTLGAAANGEVQAGSGAPLAAAAAAAAAAAVGVAAAAAAGSARAGRGGPVDVFGQSHPAKATDIVTCRNCGRQVQAGSFAPHLEKCMGKGRAAARAASRRIAAGLS